MTEDQDQRMVSALERGMPAGLAAQAIYGGQAPVEATVWEVLSIVRVTDGDTIRVFRERAVNLDGRAFRIRDDPQAEPLGTAIRLVWLDTPEKGDHPGWETAKADLRNWLMAAPMPLRVFCYESGGWDRLMGDLIDGQGNSASQWMMIERGWPPYVKG